MKKALLIVYCIIIVLQGQAQKSYNQWFFGSNCGLDFNSGAAMSIGYGALNSSEGVATWCDSNGKVRIYTDGLTVYDSSHAAMPNGNGLGGGASSSQSAIIVPKPGSQTMFYVFTVDGDGSYSELDLSLNNGKGDITIKNVSLQTNLTEKLCALKHANGVDYWVLYHGFNNSDYYAYLVTSIGVSTNAIISSVGLSHSNQIGYMKANRQGTKLACAIRYMDTYELCDFDNATGIVSNPIPFPAIYPHSYGVEFSLDGKYLYVSRGLAAGEIRQFDISSGVAATIFASDYLVGSVNSSTCGALQMGPDKKIYNCGWGNNYLSCINNPENGGAACNFVLQQTTLSNVANGGLPNIIFGFLQVATIQNFCLGDTTTFLIADSSGFAGVSWDFGDPGSGPLNNSYNYDASHYYSSPGTYNVQLVTVSLSAAVDTQYYQVEIVPCGSVVAAFASSDTLFCDKNCIDFFDQSQFNPTTWQWTFTGASPATSTDQNPTGICYNNFGSFDVTLIACSINGCDTIVIPNFITEFQLPTAPVITMQGTTLTSTPAFTYQWYIVGDTTVYSTAQTFTPTVNGNYYVLISDSNGCQVPSNVVGFYASTSNVIVQGITLSASPNGETIFIENKFQREVTYSLYDVTGRIVIRGKSTRSELINCIMLPKGYYTLSAICEGVPMQKSIVKSF
ncbi:MAG: hypothetical protein IPO27_03595 [Bacteroidetes bacterium]|nr:hypothetical protein [Bacteroidota bacterium]